MQKYSSARLALAISVIAIGADLSAGCRADPPAESPPAASTPAVIPARSTEPAAAPVPNQTPSTQLAPPAGLDLTRAPRIPLQDGLTLVHAAAEERGDYEVVMRVTRPSTDRLVISYAATLPVNGEPAELTGTRTVLARDLQAARIYRIRWIAGRNEFARGTTALGISTEVFDEVRKDGRSECSLASVDQADSMIGGLGLPSPEYEGVLERVEPGPVPVPVVVDGKREWLPAVHAKGTFEGLTGDVDAEFWILDDRDNPLTLRASLGTARMVLVRIDRPRGADGAALEPALAAGDSVDLPGVYFEFASARLRPESDAAITEIASVLRRHPDWTVRLEGHTDSVGTAEANLELSRARADAVKRAVVERLGGSEARVASAGFGHARPRENNDTPESRARNRRVEIVRIK